VIHQQFNIQQLYALPTLFMCFIFIWEQTAPCATYSINWLVFITEMKSLDIWLAVHHSIAFLLLPTWYTNFLFIHINYIKLNSSTCFERNPLIIRRSATQIVRIQPLVSSLSAQDGHLQRVTVPEAAYVQFASLTSWWWADCARNM